MEPKWFLKSKTIIGVIISVLPALLPALGVSFSADDAHLVSGTVDSVMQAIGALLAVYGRWVSTDAVKAMP